MERCEDLLGRAGDTEILAAHTAGFDALEARAPHDLAKNRESCWR